MNKKKRLQIIFIQAILATIGSLYYGWFGDPFLNIINGEFFLMENGLNPCQLCRYARILIYPITILSGLALRKKQYTSIPYIAVLSSLAVILEIYHYALQKLPIQTSTFCTRANPCSASMIDYLGFITIPFLALLASTIILIASYKIIKHTKNASD